MRTDRPCGRADARRSPRACGTGRAALAALTLSALVPLGACGGQPPATRYRVTFEIVSDQLPLGGVQLAVRGRTVGQTDASGTARFDIPGRDGLVVPVTVRCPPGTRGPANAIDVTLRTVQVLDRAAAERGIVQRVNCPPEDRTVAVVVRTDGRVGLPITWQGREISRTDQAGVAHMTFRMRPQQQIQLAMLTESVPTLRPQNPTRQFIVPDEDAIFAFDQEFHEEAPARPPRRRSGGGGRRGPRIIRIR
jgi:hypothetical protein